MPLLSLTRAELQIKKNRKKGKWSTMFHKVFHDVDNVPFDTLWNQRIVASGGQIDT